MPFNEVLVSLPPVMKKLIPCLLILTGSVLLVGCTSNKCEELRKRLGADPAVMGMTREDECARALEQFKQLDTLLPTNK